MQRIFPQRPPVEAPTLSGGTGSNGSAA
jgi:hypothetical protein